MTVKRLILIIAVILITVIVIVVAKNNDNTFLGKSNDNVDTNLETNYDSETGLYYVENEETRRNSGRKSR